MAQLVKNLSTMPETWVGKMHWRRERLPTPVFWPGEFHGQRSLVGYNGVTKSHTQLSNFQKKKGRGGELRFTQIMK